MGSQLLNPTLFEFNRKKQKKMRLQPTKHVNGRMWQRCGQSNDWLWAAGHCFVYDLPVWVANICSFITVGFLSACRVRPPWLYAPPTRIDQDERAITRGDPWMLRGQHDRRTSEQLSERDRIASS